MLRGIFSIPVTLLNVRNGAGSLVYAWQAFAPEHHPSSCLFDHCLMASVSEDIWVCTVLVLKCFLSILA